jgi:hypothetical protein
MMATNHNKTAKPTSNPQQPKRDEPPTLGGLPGIKGLGETLAPLGGANASQGSAPLFAGNPFSFKGISKPAGL